MDSNRAMGLAIVLMVFGAILQVFSLGYKMGKADALDDVVEAAHAIDCRSANIVLAHYNKPLLDCKK